MTAPRPAGAEPMAATAPPPRGLAVLLALITALGPFSIDTYLPSFPDIAASLGATPLEVQQTLAAYLLPFAATLIWHGAISDALGRRRVIIGGLALYALASIGCLAATQIEHLWLARAAQGLFAGVGMVVGRAVVRDLYEGAAAQRLMARVTVMFALAPAIGPIVGGLLQEAFGWRAVFAFLLLYSVLLGLACLRWLPETHPQSRRQSLHPVTIGRAVAVMFRHRPFMRLCAAFALNFGGLFVYILSAPMFLVEHLGLSATAFGWLFVPLTAGMMAGAWMAGRLAGLMPTARTIGLGYALMGGAAIANLAINLATPAGFGWYLAALPFYSLGMSLAIPSLTLLALDCFPDRRGLASSVQALLNSGGAGLSAALLIPLLWHEPRWLAIGMLSLLALGALASAPAWRRERGASA